MTLRKTFKSMFLHRHMRIQMIQSAIGFRTTRIRARIKSFYLSFSNRVPNMSNFVKSKVAFFLVDAKWSQTQIMKERGKRKGDRSIKVKRISTFAVQEKGVCHRPQEDHDTVRSRK